MGKRKSKMVTIRVSDNKRFRVLLRCIKKRTGEKTEEDAIIALARKLYPEIVNKIYPLEIEFLVVSNQEVKKEKLL